MKENEIKVKNEGGLILLEKKNEQSQKKKCKIKKKISESKRILKNISYKKNIKSYFKTIQRGENLKCSENYKTRFGFPSVGRNESAQAITTPNLKFVTNQPEISAQHPTECQGSDWTDKTGIVRRWPMGRDDTDQAREMRDHGPMGGKWGKGT